MLNNKNPPWVFVCKNPPKNPKPWVIGFFLITTMLKLKRPTASPPTDESVTTPSSRHDCQGKRQPEPVAEAAGDVQKPEAKSGEEATSGDKSSSKTSKPAAKTSKASSKAANKPSNKTALDSSGAENAKKRKPKESKVSLEIWCQICW